MKTSTSQVSTETDALTVQDFLGGEFTSDHTWQSVEAWLEEPTATSRKEFQSVSEPIRLTTWNMLNQCFSRETNPFGSDFANNPFDLHEHQPVYRARKVAQIDELVKIIDTIQSDFLLLQECDWVTDTDLLEKYKTALNEKGYDIILSPRTESGQPVQRSLVTVYNKNKFEVVAGSEKGVFATKKEGQNSNSLGAYCGYSIDFKHKQNQQVVTVVNLHLEFSHDYKQEISDFLTAQTAANKFTIMGGDTNHALCQGNDAMLGDYDHPTNLDLVSDVTTAKKLNIAIIKGVVITDEILVQQEPGPAKKRYDGFFACPNQTTRVVAKELEGRYFKLENGKLSVEKLNLQYRHSSKVGRPFLASFVKLPAKSFISNTLDLQRGFKRAHSSKKLTKEEIEQLNKKADKAVRESKQLIKEAERIIQKSESVLAQPLTPTTVNNTHQKDKSSRARKKDKPLQQNTSIRFKIPLAVSITLCGIALALGLLAFFNIIALPFLPFAVFAVASMAVAGLIGIGLVYAKYKTQQSCKPEDNNYQKLDNKVSAGLAELGGEHPSNQPLEVNLNLENTSTGDKLFKSDKNNNTHQAVSSVNKPNT